LKRAAELTSCSTAAFSPEVMAHTTSDDAVVDREDREQHAAVSYVIKRRRPLDVLTAVFNVEAAGVGGSGL
jgi:hypothetical protein